MARPKKSRTVCFEPDITEFIKIKNNREFVEITVDEYTLTSDSLLIYYNN